jgi:putative transposase
MSKGYQITSKKDSRQIAEFLAANAQAVLPMVDLIEESMMAIDDLVETLGRATIEAVLLISAGNVAGERRQGVKSGSEIGWHGSQGGVVSLENRKMRVSRPRLRMKGAGSGGEVSVPAYEAMQSDSRLAGYILNAMMRGVSTRNYKEILPEACEYAGVSKSSISRKFVLASEEECTKLLDRRFDDLRMLVIYVDGIVVADHSVIAAVGIDENGYKHVLGIADGATENAVVVKDLLCGMVERGIKPGVKRLFVIDGSKALRSAIDAVYGKENPVQRCRPHKARNVTAHLPDHMEEMAKCTMKAAWKLEPEEGIARLRQLAKMYEHAYPSAAASILEGVEEMFTVNRLGLPPSLRKCLVTTNIIESPNSGVRRQTRRVTNWEDGKMVRRWVASSFLSVEKGFRRIMGYKDLWMLKAALDEGVDKEEKAA